jgi:hypothetical protein
MSEEIHSSVPRSFRIIAGIALVWNLLGVGAFLAQMAVTDEVIMQLPDAERLLYETMPAWATAAFAVAVFGGALGCLLLLLKKAWATPVLILSLIGIIVQMYHSLAIANSVEVYGPGSAVMPAIVVIVGVFLVWYARHASAKGWIS